MTTSGKKRHRIYLVRNKKNRPLPPDSVRIYNPIRFDTRPKNTCGWIHGDPKDLMCCGEKTVRGHYYCTAHESAKISKEPVRW